MTDALSGGAGSPVSPETLFNEGLEAGRTLAGDEYREQLEDQLLDAGFDPDDIDEALYDPAPDPAPRKGRRRKSKKSRSRSYDPSPGRRRGRRGRRGTSRRAYDPGYRSKAKGTLTKLRKYVFPGVAGGTFLLDYNARAGVLKGQGAKLKNGTAVTDIFTAIMYDFENFDSNAAMGRLQTNMVNYGAPLVGGFALKKTNLAGKYSGILGDLLMGFGAGKLAKTIMDPPVQNAYAPPPPARSYSNGCCGNGASDVSRATAQYVPPAGQGVRQIQAPVQMPRKPAQVESGYNPYL